VASEILFRAVRAAAALKRASVAVEPRPLTRNINLDSVPMNAARALVEKMEHPSGLRLQGSEPSEAGFRAARRIARAIARASSFRREASELSRG